MSDNTNSAVSLAKELSACSKSHRRKVNTNNVDSTNDGIDIAKTTKTNGRIVDLMRSKSPELNLSDAADHSVNDAAKVDVCGDANAKIKLLDAETLMKMPKKGIAEYVVNMQSNNAERERVAQEQHNMLMHLMMQNAQMMNECNGKRRRGRKRRRIDSSDDESDSDSDFDGYGYSKNWRRNFGPKKADFVKFAAEAVTRKLRGVSSVRQCMILKNAEFNKKNVLKMGYVDWEHPGFVMFIAMVFVNELKRLCKKNDEEYKLVEQSAMNFLYNVAQDINTCSGESVANVIELMYLEIKENKDKKYLCLNGRYLEVRREYLRFDRFEIMQLEQKKQHFGGRKVVNKKEKICFEFNKTNACSYVGCRSMHICAICRSPDHGEVECPSANKRR